MGHKTMTALKENRHYLRREVERPSNMATTVFQVPLHLRDLEMCQVAAPLLFIIRVSYDLSVVGAVALSTHFIAPSSSSSSSSFSPL